jgi:5'-3' exonuclease
MTNILSLLENIKDPLYDPDLKINSKVLLIDGMNTFFRNFAVINYLNSDGSHIGGLVGFLRSLGYASNLTKATRIIIAFDGEGNITNKKNLLPEYKSNRNLSKVTNWKTFENKDEEIGAMNAQLDRLLNYLKFLPITTVVVNKAEADDVLSYYSKKIYNDDPSSLVYLMSSDRDFLQLVNDRITIFSPTKKVFYNPEEVLKEYNVTPINFLTYKVLLGDKTDNVPGIDGLGPKKILKLFPELSLNTLFSLNDVFEKCRFKQSENFMYGKILVLKEQLKINEKIMGLHANIFTSNEQDYLDDSLDNPQSVLNKKEFKTLYEMDTLGKSILNLDNWLSENFNLPDRFVNEHIN